MGTNARWRWWALGLAAGLSAGPAAEAQGVAGVARARAAGLATLNRAAVAGSMGYVHAYSPGVGLYNPAAAWGMPAFSADGTGMTSQQQQALMQQQARYQVETAQAVEAYQQAQLFQQQAAAVAPRNRNARPAMQARYDPQDATRKADPGERPGPTARPRAGAPILDSGAVAWPDFAPANPARGAVERAIDEARDSASVEAVARAKQRLQVYGRPALRAVGQRSKPLADRFRDFLNVLDAELDGLAGAG